MAASDIDASTLTFDGMKEPIYVLDNFTWESIVIGYDYYVTAHRDDEGDLVAYEIEKAAD